MRFCFLALFLPLLALWAAPPVPYSGKVSIDGINYHGSAQFSFSLKDVNGTTQWRNGADANESIRVFVDNGRYSVMLGGQGMNPLPPELFLQHEELYLSVRFDTGDGSRSLGPEQLITATPRALVAEVSKVAEVAKVAGKLSGVITSDMLSPEVLSKLDANQSGISIGPITRDMLPADVVADLNKSAPAITSITRDMLPADVLADLNKTAPAIGLITLSMLAPEVTAKLESNASGGAIGPITREMLPDDVLSDLNKSITVTRDMLPADVLEDLNKSAPSIGPITLSMLDAEVTAKLDQNATLIDGSVTANKLANNTITTSQLNEQILKYLKPEITGQPKGQVVYADSNVSFSVTAEGKFLTYQWKNDGSSLTGETNATLTITDANATQHDGNYTVVVSNDFGSVESGLVAVQVSDALMNGLVGWWKFDETNGTVAYDSSGNGNDGNLTGGPTWTTGKIGGALSFDGVDDQLNTSKLLVSSTFTFTFFAYPSATTRTPTESSNSAIHQQDNHKILLNPSIPANGSSNAGFGVSLGTNSIYMIGHAGNYYSPLLVNESEYTRWSIFCFIIVNNEPRLYVDGIFIKNGITQDRTLHILARNGKAIGAGNYGSFKGLIDDVRIYDRALSAAEVQALYNLGQ